MCWRKYSDGRYLANASSSSWVTISSNWKSSDSSRNGTHPMPLSADTTLSFGYLSNRLLMHRFTTMRTLLMNIWDEPTASRRCVPNDDQAAGTADPFGPPAGLLEPRMASSSSRRAPAPMWKLATAPDSLNRSYMGS